MQAVPHAVSEDDTWNGYFIPKNTVVFGNVWAIHMDPNRYPNPTVFNPDRFLTKDGSIRWGGGSVAHERDQLSTHTSSIKMILTLKIAMCLVGVDDSGMFSPGSVLVMRTRTKILTRMNIQPWKSYSRSKSFHSAITHYMGD